MGRRRTLGVLLGALAMVLAWVPTVGAAPDPPAPGNPTAGDPTMGDPAFSVDLETLDAAVDCDPFTHPETEPVLLVHGTSVRGHEQWDWNYVPYLRDSGRDVCIVTYPDRGFGDMQTSAEYVARAVQRVHAESDRKVDIVGHSQGALVPRWAIKFWPSVQASVDDFVALAGPQHGAALASELPDSAPPRPAVTFQFAAGSQFLAALNARDETPGDIDYTAIYTLLDELVQPVNPPTAALASSDGQTNVANIAIQDICPLRLVDHFTIGTTDALTMRLVVDALGNDGPADVARAAIDEATCSIADQYVAPDAIETLLRQLPQTLRTGIPDLHLATEEPPLRAYVPALEPETDVDEDEDGKVESTDADNAPPEGSSEKPSNGDNSGETPTAPNSPAGDSDGAAADGPEEPADAGPSADAGDDDTAATGSEAQVTPAANSGIQLMSRTGAAIPLVAATIAIAVAFLLRLGNSRKD